MTMRLLRLGALTLGLGFALAACGPSIDAAAKADLDRRVGAFAPTGQGFAAPTVLAPRSLVMGQWALYKLVNEKNEVSLITYKVVGTDADAYWIEVANESYYGKTVTKLLLVPGDRVNPGTMDIRAVKTRDKRGKVTELQGPVIQLMRSTWQSTVNMLAVSWQGLPQEDMSALAGNFTACFKARTDASWGGWHTAAVAWMHPKVPIGSLVKSVGIDKPTSMELVGFGEEGAASEIP